MTNNNNQEKSKDFSPDLSVPKENVKVFKTSVNFDTNTYLKLKNLKDNGTNVSNYVNNIVSEHFKLENQLFKDVYKKGADDYVTVDLLLHKDVARLLKWLELNRGAISLANKLAEVLANDSTLEGKLLSGNCSVYGGNTLEKALNKIRRSFDKLE